MNRFNRDRSRERDLQRASDTLTKLYSGQLDTAAAEALNPWRAEDSGYLEEFLGTAHLLGDMKALADDPDIAKVMDAPVVPEPVNKKWPGLAVAASVVLAIAIGLGVYIGQDHSGSSSNSGNVLRYVTKVGEQKTVELKDGSILMLNTATELLVDITDQYRHVFLERGEAYFDIAKDPNRTFTVDMGLHSVTVLGTEFNIRKTSESFVVAVLGGTVSLHQQDEEPSSSASLPADPDGKGQTIQSPSQYRLEAGWVARVNTTGGELSGYQPDNISSLQNWRSGVIEFEGTPLYQVARELNRYSAKKILIEDPSIVDMEIYAVMHVNSIRVALTGLQKALPIKVLHEFDRIVIVRPD